MLSSSWLKSPQLQSSNNHSITSDLIKTIPVFPNRETFFVSLSKTCDPRQAFSRIFDRATKRTLVGEFFSNTRSIGSIQRLQPYSPEDERLEHAPRKINECPLKRDYFNRKYIFQPSFFRGYVSFQGGNSLEVWLEDHFPFFSWVMAVGEPAVNLPGCI